MDSLFLSFFSFFGLLSYELGLELGRYYGVLDARLTGE